jgi:hypothetical protein
MSSLKNPKWKQFEKLAANLQQKLSPEATVMINDRIKGHHSGTLRQIDISIRKTIGQFNLLIVIDCKDYSKPIDVKVVENFLGLVADVRANKGALISSNGFTKAAKIRALDAGVEVLRLIDAESVNWNSYAMIPFVCDFRGFGMGNFIINGSTLICNELLIQEPAFIPLYDNLRKPIGTPLSLLWSMWNKREISEEPGVQNIRLKPEPLFVKSQNDGFVEIGIIGKFEVLQKLYFGNLPLTKFEGFRDEATGKIIFPNNSEIITDYIDTKTVESDWQLIPSINVLAVKPLMVLTAFDIYPSTIPDNYHPRRLIN